jgi:hypothetical protein
MLSEELHTANQAMIALFESVGEDVPSPPTVRTVMVTLRAVADGSVSAQIYFAELGFKQYALLQRLHLLDHRTQIKKLRASLSAASVQAK